MDAIVIQIAKEFNAALISLDDEMTKKAEGIVRVKSVDTLVQIITGQTNLINQINQRKQKSQISRPDTIKT